jgi:hypothetical protein
LFLCAGSSSNPPNDSSQAKPSTSSSGSDDQKRRDDERLLQKKQHEALSRLQATISNDADDYLDIDLESEETFLQRYKSLLS